MVRANAVQRCGSTRKQPRLQCTISTHIAHTQCVEYTKHAACAQYVDLALAVHHANSSWLCTQASEASAYWDGVLTDNVAPNYIHIYPSSAGTPLQRQVR
jgi:hypothetical protein